MLYFFSKVSRLEVGERLPVRLEIPLCWFLKEYFDIKRDKVLENSLTKISIDSGVQLLGAIFSKDLIVSCLI
uniref:Uncharacterized protein n=1 Tax=uncultured marine virus TaxID=186617 RepID=A0A0F7LAU5_9VIRU|nr:hypothetical protein [uncultured marine virus]